jgi:putative restriction endonuclease
MPADDLLRAAAFAYLDVLTAVSGGPVTRTELEAFVFDGQPVRLIAPRQGIWKPKFLDAAISFITTFVPPDQPPPYDDAEGSDGYLRYKWRGTNPKLSDNVALRRAMAEGLPLAWFWGIAPGVYLPLYPVWLVDEEPSRHQFVVAVDEVMRDTWRRDPDAAAPFAPTRRYAEIVVRQRLHQRLFSGRVLRAYAYQCALCRLRYRELLDAAHIKADGEGGEPIVPNGVAMCAIHHRAFDKDILAVRPDYRIEIRPDVLTGRDGPTLRHALQGLNKELILLPGHRAERPDRDLLEERYERFLAAS